ncbi:MAG: hypothetical protein ACNA8P_04005 [Phycisphaerales bacterium]
MPDTPNPYRQHANSLTPEERRLSHRLDELGRIEAQQAAPGLEDRLFASTRNHIAPPAPLNRPGIFAIVQARWRPLAAAACVAIAAGIGALAVFGPGSSPTAQPGTSLIALAELEAEAGFTLDALLASYTVEDRSPRTAPTDAHSFWGTSSDDLLDDSLDMEISL